ncbi:MAG: hypothetical protein A2329_07540 [Sulfurimonas sp. RIFOXYB2_FULL_37_5]|uniref:AbiTii domain-containing protein n=1 Tax=Sulfurimonas sp. RIFOXYB12_FULL_35_9 TaxID=1802256 RepID=UPI0008D77FEF|nr:hypothetical protein [Sulfurimonas sp. RIFOXYB12_FULL_35_9]MBS4068681.1 hypothetical protein [Sulfurimonas sp.]OHE03680.1 MAG: hypothetical protein A2345_04850 [Sulfurimonas sp. RIFOXYB12_FULL_35_9]OHE12261.1 MAG: hypothetical protein A2329_07540 [Sulfurimonas sp. RIFOXYB2_FULL_37_5]
MKPIVIELQQDALNSDIPVTDLLRKAYVVARKLKLSDFEKWIKLELYGYLGNENTPEYRNVHGSVKAWNPYHGWQPIYFEEPTIAESLSKRKSTQRVAELESLLQKGDNLQMPFSAEQENEICNAIGERVQVTLMTPSTNIIRVIDAVRNIILNWALKLEEDGVLGENMTFSDDEKDKAESHSYNVNHFYAEVTGSQIQQSSPNAKQTQSLKEFSTTNINNFISSLKEKINDIEVNEDISKELNAEISTIEIQSSSPKPKKGIIKESLSSIRTILEGATGSVAGQLLLELGKLI